MSPRMVAATITVSGLPKVRELHAAVHAVLLARLLPPHEIGIEEWNRLITAHDALCEAEMLA